MFAFNQNVLLFCWTQIASLNIDHPHFYTNSDKNTRRCSSSSRWQRPLHPSISSAPSQLLSPVVGRGLSVTGRTPLPLHRGAPAWRVGNLPAKRLRPRLRTSFTLPLAPRARKVYKPPAICTLLLVATGGALVTVKAPCPMHCSHLTQFIPVGVSQWQWYILSVILLMYNHSARSQPTVIFTSMGWGNNESTIHKLSKEVGARGGWGLLGCVGVSGGVRRTEDGSIPGVAVFIAAWQGGNGEGRSFESWLLTAMSASCWPGSLELLVL